jgi:hypothetical protein
LGFDVGHYETPREDPPKSEVEREGVTSVGRDGCTVGCEEIVAGSLPESWDEPSGKHADVRTSVDQEYQVADSSMINRRAGGVERVSVAINTCCYRFLAGGRSTVVYTFSPYLRIAGGIDNKHDPQSRGQGKGLVRLPPVPGMRAVSGAAAGPGYHLAGQIVSPLQQGSGVGGLGD